MVLKSYERLRQQLFRREFLVCLTQFGRGVWGSDFGSVGFVFQKAPPKGRRGSYRKLFERHVDVRSNTKIEALFRDRNYNAFTVSQDDYSAIPGSPLAYWLDQAVMGNYKTGRLLGDIAYPRKGMDTGDNGEFLRMWWEVSRTRLATIGEDDRKWLPYNKGGGFRRWYGNRAVVVNWDSDGAAIRARLSWPSRTPTLRNQEFMKREGFSWGTVSSGGFSARYSPWGALFDNGGCTLFADRDLEHLGALLNSSTADLYLDFLAPTLNFQPGDVAKIPIPQGFGTLKLESRRCIEISKNDWDSREESFDFKRLRLVTLAPLLRDAAEMEFKVGCALTMELQDLEEFNNRAIASAYNLAGIVSTQVAPEKVSLSCNPAYRFGGGSNRDQWGSRMTRELTAELVSYAVGCTFGRYSLDEHGLILADQGATLQDYLTKVPTPSFTPDADNVVPIVDGDWFEDDIVGRFRQFLRIAFGDKYFEENLNFVAESLGVKNLREYFITKAGKSKFYDDHVQRVQEASDLLAVLKSQGIVQRPDLPTPLHAVDRLNSADVPA